MKLFSDAKERDYLEKFCTGLSESDKSRFDLMYDERRKNPTIAFFLSLLLGFASADRFYLGQVGIGFGKIAFFLISRSIAFLYLHLLNLIHFGNFFDSMLSSNSNPMFSLLFLQLLPYAWIVADVFLIIPITFKENKRSIEDVYIRLVYGQRKKN